MTSYVDPARLAIAITPSDSANIVNNGQLTRGIYVGGAGNISVEMGQGTVVFYNAVAGSVLPLRVQRVNATGTTASNLVGLY